MAAPGCFRLCLVAKSCVEAFHILEILFLAKQYYVNSKSEVRYTGLHVAPFGCFRQKKKRQTVLPAWRFFMLISASSRTGDSPPASQGTGLGSRPAPSPGSLPGAPPSDCPWLSGSVPAPCGSTRNTRRRAGITASRMWSSLSTTEIRQR